MIQEARLIGYDYSVYAELIAIVVVLCLCMIACSIWLTHQKRSFKFIVSVWCGFLPLLLFGTVGMSFFIYQQRIDWTAYCSKLVAYYANVVNQLDHDKIQPGNPDVFSDWSPKLVMSFEQQTDAMLLRSEEDTFSNRQSDPLSSSEKLGIPEGLTADWSSLLQASSMPTHLIRRNQWAVAELTQDSYAFDRSVQKVYVRWDSVPQATTYRLQWKNADCENTDWITVYTGAKPSCAITIPQGVSLAFRVRAEDGTPEDCPHFTRIVDILDFPAATNIYVGYVYTMRSAGQEQSQFIVAPISDANKNGVIDANEMPNDIGELYPKTPIFRHVLGYKERAMDFETLEDQWGRWFIIAEPIWTRDNKMEGLLGMDFRANVVLRAMFYERLYPLCLFILVMSVYFSAILFINHLQIKTAVVSQLASELQHVVSELTEAQRATEKALQVKTLFLTNMSHEFRTPLNGILGFIGILERSSFRCAAEERAMCQEAIKQVKDNGKSLLKLVDNLLGMAAMDGTQTPQLQFTAFHIHNLILEVANMMQSRAECKSLTLTIDESQDTPKWITSDPKHIRQVLLLLIDNAIKFTQEGSVSIHYGILPEQQQRAPMFYVSVSDTGIGIAPDQVRSIFKPFSQSDPTSTREYGGMGIGLAVARQAAEMLNGNISVKSQPGLGSTFTFTFPGQIAEPPPQESSTESTVVQNTATLPIVKSTRSDIRPASEGEHPLASCRILVVDDTKANQIVIVNQLEELGATTETAENGQIGIDKITEAETRGEPFDIILMDMQMPVLDGYAATRHLRAYGYFKPIIAVTAHALPEDRERTLEAGCDEYITKPVDFLRLTKVIQTLWK